MKHLRNSSYSHHQIHPNHHIDLKSSCKLPNKHFTKTPTLSIHHASYIHPPLCPAHYSHHPHNRPPFAEEPSRSGPQAHTRYSRCRNYHHHYNHHQDNTHHWCGPSPCHRCAGAPPQAPRNHGRQGVWCSDEVEGKLDQEAWIEGMLLTTSEMNEPEANK